MKWIPLSERKPDCTLFTIYYHFTDGKVIWQQHAISPIPCTATHWLEFELPQLPKDENEPTIGHFNLTSDRPFEGDVVDNVNEPVRINVGSQCRESKDPDWNILSGNYSRWLKDKISQDEFITQIYEFLKAKYGE